MNDKEYKRYFCSKELEDVLVKYDEKVAKNNVTTNELKIEIIENGIVYPLETVGDNRYGGVTDADGNLNILSVQRIGNLGSIPNKEYPYSGANPKYNISDIKYVDEDVVFIGCMHGHYMHFLLESMSRMWYYLDNGFKYKAVYVQFDSRFPQYFYEFMDMFEFPKENLICVETPTKFRSVIIPEQSIILHKNINYRYKDIIERLKKMLYPRLIRKSIFLKKILIQ